MFSFQANDPHVFLPQPASTVPEAVSSPAVNAILINLQEYTCAFFYARSA
jgi:hypothetical protein